MTYVAQPSRILFISLKYLVILGTFPYYRIFHFNTLQPIHLMAFYTSRPEEHSKLLYHLDRWRTCKLAELHFVSIAVSPKSTTPDISSHSWTDALTVCYLGRCGHWFILLECYSRRILVGLGTLVLQPCSVHSRDPLIGITGRSTSTTWTTPNPRLMEA